MWQLAYNSGGDIEGMGAALLFAGGLAVVVIYFLYKKINNDQIDLYEMAGAFGVGSIGFGLILGLILLVADFF